MLLIAFTVIIDNIKYTSSRKFLLLFKCQGTIRPADLLRDSIVPHPDLITWSAPCLFCAAPRSHFHLSAQGQPGMAPGYWVSPVLRQNRAFRVSSEWFFVVARDDGLKPNKHKVVSLLAHPLSSLNNNQLTLFQRCFRDINFRSE